MLSKFTVERVVAFLTPVFSAAAAWLTGAVAKYGLHLDKTAVGVAFAAGATLAALAALKWLDGRAKFVALERTLSHEAAKLAPEVKALAPGLGAQLAGEAKAAEATVVTAIVSDTAEAASPPPATLSPALVAP